VIGPPLRCGIAKIAKPTGSKHTPFLTQVDGGVLGVGAGSTIRGYEIATIRQAASCDLPHPSTPTAIPHFSLMQPPKERYKILRQASLSCSPITAFPLVGQGHSGLGVQARHPAGRRAKECGAAVASILKRMRGYVVWSPITAFPLVGQGHSGLGLQARHPAGRRAKECGAAVASILSRGSRPELISPGLLGATVTLTTP
jgi:hypothetical protein